MESSLNACWTPNLQDGKANRAYHGDVSWGSVRTRAHAMKPHVEEPKMKGQESKKTPKKEPAKTMKEKKEAKKIKKEEKSRQ